MSKKLRKLKSLCKGTKKRGVRYIINIDNFYLYSESMIKKKIFEKRSSEIWKW